MPRADSFDEFYRESRDRLLHQTYAYAGSVEEAQRAVSDAYVSAAAHWRRVAASPDRDAWVRARAFRATTRARNRSRQPWYVTARSTADKHRRVLAALGSLPPADRHLLIVSELAGIELTVAAAEAGVSPAMAQASIDTSLRELEAAGVDTSPTELDAALAGLRQDLGHQPADRSSRLRREGNRRRRAYQVLAGVVVVAVAGTAVVVVDRSSDDAASQNRQPPATTGPTSSVTPTSGSPEPTVGVAALTAISAVRTLDPAASWHLDSTSTDLATTKTSDPCLTSAPALSTANHYWERRFSTGGPAAKDSTRTVATQTPDVATSRRTAQTAYAARLAAFGGCAVGAHRLVEVKKLSGVASVASVVDLEYVDRAGLHDEVVTIARTGGVVTTWIVHEPQGTPPRSRPVVRLLAESVDSVCGIARAACPQPPYRATPIPPPPDGTAPGFVSLVDLPLFADVPRTWVATPPEPARQNPSATSCDQADLTGAGATSVTARTYVIPGSASLPSSFGMSETIGTFASRTQANAFVTTVAAAVASCPKRNLTLSVPRTTQISPDQGRGFVWQIDLQTSTSSALVSRVALIRVGDTVAELTFTPTATDDVGATGYALLAGRAAERLSEL